MDAGPAEREAIEGFYGDSSFHVGPRDSRVANARGAQLKRLIMDALPRAVRGARGRALRQPRSRPSAAGPRPATAGRPRRALALAYFFPPLGGGGVQRTLKHVKYLPDGGFETIVLTTRFGWSPTRDPTLKAEVPSGTVVIRAPEVPLQVIKWALHGMLRRARLPTSAAAYIGWPDEMAGWVPGATWHAFKAIRHYRPSVLYSTSSPVSAHLVALIVSRVTGMPWVADFRDAWTRNPQGERLGKPLGTLSARLERAVVNRALYLVVVDDSVELLGIEHNDPRRVVIRNGVDPEDIPPTRAHTRGKRFRISYVGALYGERNAAPVFAALRTLLRRGVIDTEELEIRLVGHRAPDTDAHLHGLPVATIGYLDHVTAVAEMVAADVLLFYAPVSNRGSSGKIYEYLASGRPILCVAGDDNFASQLVQELGAGRCVEPGDQSAIEEAIEVLYRRWHAGELDVDPQVKAEALRRFSRAALARELAAVLEAAAEAAPRGLWRRLGPGRHSREDALTRPNVQATPLGSGDRRLR